MDKSAEAEFEEPPSRGFKSSSCLDTISPRSTPAATRSEAPRGFPVGQARTFGRTSFPIGQGSRDFRSDADGVPQFLEANPLSGLCPDYSDLPILAELAGLPYETFMGEIMRAAIGRLGLGFSRSASSTAA